jgi:hypothetical protein
MITDGGKKMGRLITLFFAGAFLLAVTGCGPVDDVTDESSTYEQVFPPAENDTGDNGVAIGESGESWFVGADVLFANEKVVEDVWSVYRQGNAENIEDTVVFYDLYERGYDFRSDGQTFVRQKTKTFSGSAQWGVNDAGTELFLDDPYNYVYVYESVFSNDENCFKVVENSRTVRFCKESFVDQTNENADGFYGSGVTFGNRTNYNFDAVGAWEISPYEADGPVDTVTLNADGSTSGGGEWGVSRDGKVMTIDGTSYLVYRYLRPKEDKCIAVYELAGDIITPSVWKLCKQ